MNFNYLQRDLFANFEKMLRPVVWSWLKLVRAARNETGGSEFSPEHYLEPGELKSLFRDWEILLYVERENIVNGKPRGKSSLIARLPG
jgi:hypothetical protein